MSFFGRTRRALDKFARSPVGFFACHFILVLMVLGNIYLYVDWWETNFPEPPLGILTGELLKAFDRYSPEDNHSEEVLAEVFSPDVETRIPCITPGCQWLEKEIHGTPLVGRSAAACDNFYIHVCGGRPGRLASLHQRAAEDMMVAVVDHLLTAPSPGNNGHDTADHLRVLRKCVNGEEAMEFALTCDFSPSSTDSDVRCPDHYPFVPRTQSEIIFKADTPTTAEELVSRIERSLQKPNASVTLEQEGPKRSHIMTQRVHSFCRWLADSARCHLRELFTNGSEDDITRRYQRLWNELFFAPLSLSQDGIALWELGGGGEAARKRACAQIHEALFKAESAKAATAVLDGLTGDVQATIAELMEHAQYILHQRVPYWLSRHEEGESTGLQEKRRPAYLAELDAVRAELAGVAAPSADGYGTSIYSCKVSYDRARNVLTVPHGLLALLTEERDVMKPVMTVPVSVPLLHALLPRPTGPYSWKDPHDQHLSYVMECFRSVHNATLDVNGDAALLRELVYESALLGPLFDAYRMAVIEYFDKSVSLSKDYDNWQLFYVIWTRSHCGDPRGGDFLNAVLRNSVRFTRSFDCGMKDSMFSRRKCNFWVYW